jgi:hypothetical protein
VLVSVCVFSCVVPFVGSAGERGAEAVSLPFLPFRTFFGVTAAHPKYFPNASNRFNHFPNISFP